VPGENAEERIAPVAFDEAQLERELAEKEAESTRTEAHERRWSFWKNVISALIIFVFTTGFITFLTFIHTNYTTCRSLSIHVYDWGPRGARSLTVWTATGSGRGCDNERNRRRPIATGVISAERPSKTRCLLEHLSQIKCTASLNRPGQHQAHANLGRT
jgi:hypothetical protein